MKKISALFLVLCMMFSIIPMTAFAAEVESEAQTSSEAETPAADCETLGSSGIGILSEWEDGDSEFFTKIRLTATDRDGNPIAGAVYGLYRTSDDGLVEYLTTDRYGVAVSSDVPVETDYYLLEYSTPEGFLPNPDPKYINLTEICAPSRVDENVVYDPITGIIKVIKTDEDGNPLSGAGFYVYRSDTWEIVDTIYTDSSGEAYTGTLPYGLYELYEFDVPQGMAGGGYYSQMIQYDGETHELYITNYRAYGNMYVYKTGNDGRNIAGAVFSIYRADNDEWIEDITTGSSGYAYSSSLQLGDYYTIEKSVPAPYALDETRRDFSISYNGETVSFALTNDREGENGSIKVIKTDDSGNPLSGVVFGVYRSWDGKKMTELTTGEDGTAEYSLIPDDYYLVELSGKSGYEMAEGQTTFTIDGTGATVEKTVVNPKIRIFGKVNIIKTDDAQNPISGVRLGVYCASGNLLEELTTGEDGTATSGVLNEGTGYYILEHEGVAGYLPDTETRYPFDIAQNNTVVSVTVENPRITGSIKIIKDDGDGNPLAGVLFGIYKGGEKLTELTTGADGTAESAALFYGDDYELRELATVEGYERIDAAIPFSVLEQGAVIEIPVSNPLILGSVTVIKVDAAGIPQVTAATEDEPQGNRLTGAVFGIYNAQGQKIAEMTVDKNGSATYGSLPKSSYFLKELVAPEGFIPLDELIPFAITEQGEQIQIVVPNVQGYGKVKIIKHGENEVLPGVVFEVYRVDGDAKITELTTSTDGTAAAELPLGRYYLLEKSTVAGYKLLTGKVFFTLTDEGATVELPIENQKEPTPEGGKIKLIKRSDKDNALLPGAVFGVYRVSDNKKVAELVTGSDGTSTSAALPEVEQGYYLLELAAPADYKAVTEKIPVAVKNGKTTEITVKNTPVDTTPNPETPKPGKLVLTKEAEDTGKKLSGAVFGVYSVDGDKKQGEITTDKDGKATLELPAGRYYLLELKAPHNFQLSGEKVYFRITSNKSTEITVENAAIKPDPEKPDPEKPDPEKPDPEKPKTGKIELLKKAAGTGERLPGAVFGVYRVSDNTKIGELTNDKDGKASMELAEGDFYLKELSAPSGFAVEKSKIKFTISAGITVLVEVTNMRDPVTIGDDEPPQGSITIPKTGGDFPAMSYALAALSFSLAAVCGAVLWKRKRGSTTVK